MLNTQQGDTQYRWLSIKYLEFLLFDFEPPYSPNLLQTIKTQRSIEVYQLPSYLSSTHFLTWIVNSFTFLKKKKDRKFLIICRILQKFVVNFQFWLFVQRFIVRRHITITCSLKSWF